MISSGFDRCDSRFNGEMVWNRIHRIEEPLWNETRYNFIWVIKYHHQTPAQVSPNSGGGSHTQLCLVDRWQKMSLLITESLQNALVKMRNLRVEIGNGLKTLVIPVQIVSKGSAVSLHVLLNVKSWILKNFSNQFDECFYYFPFMENLWVFVFLLIFIVPARD